MPIPAEWDDRVLERTYEDEYGTPMTGTVTVTATVPYVEASSEATAWFSRPRTTTLDSAGKATITVRVADPDMRQYDYTHRVVEELRYPDIPGQPTPASVRSEYYILVEPGPDPLLYGALAPVAPSAGVAAVNPLFTGPAGAPGSPGANGINGINGTDGAQGPPGAPGPPGVGKSAYQEWLDLGNTGTVDDFLADLIDLSTVLPVRNGVVALTPSGDKFVRLTVTDDGTDTAAWPNRLEVLFTGAGKPGHLTHWLNEYGEMRATPAKPNTVPVRLYTRDVPTSPAHTVNMIEVASDRTDRVLKFGVDTDGKVTAPNIGAKVVAQATAPSDTSVVWVDTSA